MLAHFQLQIVVTDNFVLSGMEIRNYQINDTEQIARLFRSTVREINSRDYSPEQISAWASETLDNNFWQQKLGSKITKVAVVDNLIVGFAQMEATGYIDCFYCHKDFIGQGIGTRLFIVLEAEARNLKIKRLFSQVSITAKPFFENKGFVVLAKQNVLVRNVAMTNYAMEKHLYSN